MTLCRDCGERMGVDDGARRCRVCELARVEADKATIVRKHKKSPDWTPDGHRIVNRIHHAKRTVRKTTKWMQLARRKARTVA